jgi:hypothetical protein
MALSELSGDEQGIILGQLWNPLEPRLAVYLSSANKELRLLLTPALRQQLRADHTAAAALCRKVGFPSCKELREAKVVHWFGKCFSAADLTTLGTLGSVLPALESLAICEFSVGVGAAGHEGVQWLAEGLVAGALPAVRFVFFNTVYMGDAGASAFAAALDQGALPQLEKLCLINTAIGDAALVALAPALRRRSALELNFRCNPLGDEGLAALVAPPLPAGVLPPPTGGLKLKTLDLSHTKVSDAGCTALAAALHSGALPALEELMLDGIPASAVAKVAAACKARDTLLFASHLEEFGFESGSESDENEDEEGGD